MSEPETTETTEPPENTGDSENLIVCLNYCMTDPETGYCLTCGRPPVPVVAFSPRFFGRLSLANMTIVETPRETIDEKQKLD